MPGVAEFVEFPDVEAALVSYLKVTLAERGDTAKVATKVPNPRPARLVRLVRAGGLQRDRATDRPRVVLECWEATEPAAAALAKRVRAMIAGAAPGYVGGVWCDQVDDAGLAFSPDPDTATPRYLITAELHVTGSAV